MPLTSLIDLTGAAGWTAMLMPFALLAIAIAVALVERSTARGEPVVAAPAAPPRGPDELRPHVSHAPPADVRDTAPATDAVTRSPTAWPQRNQRAAAAGDARSSPPPQAAPAEVPRSVAPKAADVAPPPTTAPALAPAPARETAATPRTVDAPPARPQPARAQPAGTALLADEIAAIERGIRAAIAKSDEAAVARLSLELARKLAGGHAEGHDVEGYLRRAITSAMRIGDTGTHAAARLELGDRVGARGDMITACEHWQIARQIYWDESRADGIAEADRRMIANGCPTDWVLNDF